jgi:hypothetical protein
MSIKMLSKVSLRGLTPQMAAALPVVRDVFHDNEADCIVTCGTEGKHSHTSLHPAGNALDFRTKHLDPPTKVKVLEGVQHGLPDEYDAILEDIRGPNEHLHVEWQPKGDA